MTFREAVEATAGLAGAFCEGLQAVEPRDRARLDIEDTRRLRGSVYLDQCLPGARWDYGIAYQEASRTIVYWVEVHGATDAKWADVLAKLDWLKGWLKSEGRLLAPDHFPPRYCWVASGSYRLGQRARAAAERALYFTTKRLRIPLSTR